MGSIRFEHIYKKYPNGELPAVKDFNLAVKDGEFIVFVGPSGCGKSTTLRMLAGLEEITSGDLYIDDVRINDKEPKDRDIAMVFQSYALYPHMNVYENMAFALKLRKVPKDEIEKRVQNAAEILALTEYLKRKPKDLSGGQRQRVALGRAMVRDAKIFLMDEPLSNLDAKLRVAMRSELIKLHDRLKTTTIYVTHDQVEAMTMANRIVLMKDGVIQQIGTPWEIYHRPANTFVAGFIGSPAMNILPATLQADGMQVGDLSISLESEVMKIIKDAMPSETSMQLGIRPEDIKLTLNADANLDDIVTFEGKIDFVELLGAEQIVHLQLAGQEILVKVESAWPVTAGSLTKFYVDKHYLHLFMASDGSSIIHHITMRD
ncbi:ABC transporter ATP-binding protein [Entomospira culicis]|uniref:Sn-glycerol-3-phosphate ABC transporter ATP-binding protein UgpC n=1 Tax=Entomospira culicis TaxID=2719989 RepID=A0A968GF73_9SPIO|nr:sn-glycerol-3-phosphate ABC transporter ATP-binding protein UgpC [Entomospira culicis]NIZ19179.1 sn-glycerol-3-phosphate ABC transporter ATP-binding protein UgpC [Entomospira culicis]NIZ69393.1 sn-glycerol-3-phosphate ABC transporter ATP-binding protein UgpC [Entomospira culicis]WDI36510.1 sn-glycerol-3-phosphate ABC transporter ATP-binding protein UgpC [Entomospira culicis]WDI38136.1 sn-glycerol-3-phosphate ABC transporter ATP-binding protein UgpC [Entomospira culicis]